MEILGTNKRDSLGQMTNSNRASTLVFVADSELTKEVAAKSVDCAITRKNYGMCVTSADMPDHDAQKSCDKSRLSLSLGIAVTQLAVDSPTPGEDSAVGCKCY